MTGLMVDQGEVLALKALLNHTAPQTLVLKLYKNNYTPIDASIESDFTESTFSGYLAISLTGGGWIVTGGAPTEAVFAQQTFASDADQTAELCYGYFIIQTTSGKLIWAEKFTDGPYSISANGDDIKVTPKIQYKKPGE